MPVTMEAVDAKGRVVPGAAPMVTIRTEGPIRLLGIGNGDPNCHEPEQTESHSLFHGLGQAIVRSLPGAHGDAVMHVSTPGLKEASVTIPVNAAAIPPSVPPAPPIQILAKWRMSPLAEAKPDPGAKVADNDMNTWTQVKLPRLENTPKQGWIAFRSDRFKPFEQQAKEGGMIRFHEIRGKGEIWLDGVKVYDKTQPYTLPVEIPLPPGDHEHQLIVLLQKGDDAKEAGLGGVVSVESVSRPTP